MANLPVPTLTAPTVGTFATGAWWNANVSTLLTYGLNQPLFVGTQTIAQAVATGTWTPLTLDTEQVDTYAGHSATTNSSRYTAQVPGWYTVCGVSAWASNATGVRRSRLHVNGASVPGSSQMVPTATTGSVTGVMTPVRAVFLDAGDYVEVVGWQNSGGNLATAVASDLATALFVAWSHA
ncbi:hypothetical protein ACFZB5_13420 [Streptomyces nodosus]|uniref:hypothetical protein n=1 Tax=Streptomyces nodosus TaxID=40318 RepID=UPI0036ED2CEA